MLIHLAVILNALLATFNGRPSLQRKMMAVTVQHAPLDSEQSGRNVHSKRDVRTRPNINVIPFTDVASLQPSLGINVVELGPLDTRGSASQ